MDQVLARVVENQPVAEGIHRLRLAAPEVATNARPGQFVHVRCSPVGGNAWDPLLRRPLGVLRADRQAGEFECLFEVVGRGTAALSRVRAGERLDVLGPVGRPFEVARTNRQALLIAGGLGIVPLVALAEELIAREVATTLLAGYRTAARSIPAEILPPEVEYLVATEDGSLGQPGFVTGLVGDYLAWADQVFACGPLPMLKAVARLPLPASLDVQVSLEERMACGLGACLGCVVETKQGLQRVCRDGPVFRLSDLVW